MKSFIANGPIAIDIHNFKMNVKKTVSIVTSPTKITHEILGSFSVTYEECDNNQIDIDENLCIVSGKRIITGIEIHQDKHDDECSNYRFTATDVDPYGL